MSGLDRYLRVLRLFSDQHSNWTVQDLTQAAQVPQSTMYRVVSELVQSGLLETAREATYRLGPAFLEFDRLIRRTDPLVRLGAGMLADLAAQVGQPCVVVLARLYGDQVMCVADDSSGDGGPLTSYERGRPMPLTRGATSKTILAQLPSRRLKSLLASCGSETAEDELRRQLSAIRRHGFNVTSSEVDPGLVGIAAPVACPELAITASLSIIAEAASLADTAQDRLVTTVRQAAEELQRLLSAEAANLD